MKNKTKKPKTHLCFDFSIDNKEKEKTFEERLKEIKSNNVYLTYDVILYGDAEQFFLSELEDIIGEIKKEMFYEMNNVVNKDYARGNDDALKGAIQIIKSRLSK
jgi:hypothetical protein